jgi:hypothetical protein
MISLIYPSFLEWVDPVCGCGRVARKIWAESHENKYGANERAQMLKYHIQTSGRSLHAQEIDFNDIHYDFTSSCTRFMTIVIHYIMPMMSNHSTNRVSASCNGDSVDY